MAHRDRLSELDVDTCLRLLEAHHFGRLAVNDEGGPIVLPVNYVLDQGTVLFRTDEGTKLEAAIELQRATFQVDHVDEAHRVGWSVMVRGKVTEVTDPDELERIHDLPLDPFAGGYRPRFVRILSAAITGRQVAVPAGLPPGWLRPKADLGNVWFGADGDDLGLS